MTGSCIVGLFKSSGPPNITGLIPCVVVNPIYAVSWRRPGANVAVEGLKIAQPLTADGYTSTSVISVVDVLGISDTVFNAKPY